MLLRGIEFKHYQEMQTVALIPFCCLLKSRWAAFFLAVFQPLSLPRTRDVFRVIITVEMARKLIHYRTSYNTKTKSFQIWYQKVLQIQKWDKEYLWQANKSKTQIAQWQVCTKIAFHFRAGIFRNFRQNVLFVVLSLVYNKVSCGQKHKFHFFIGILLSQIIETFLQNPQKSKSILNFSNASNIKI